MSESLGFRSRARFAAVITILVALIVSGWAYYDWSRYRASNAEAARVKQILASTENLLSRLLDAESSQRGFLLTGEDRYLAPYDHAVRAVPNELSTLTSLIGRDSVQGGNLRTLSSLVGQKLSE